MLICNALLLTSLLLAASSAWAGDLAIVSTGAPVVVVRGSAVLGSTPLTLPNLPEGRMELGFREGPLSSTVFTQVVAVPEGGVLRLEVDLPGRTVRADQPLAPLVGEVPTPARGAPPQPSVPSAAPAVPSGEIYVTSAPTGAAIFLDGIATGAVTPFMLRDVPVGKHQVETRTDCARASAEMTIAKQLIARADLTLVAERGVLVVSTFVPDSRVEMDGAEVGAAPLTLGDVRCGHHTVAIRAPGYLETSSDITIGGAETVNLVVTNGTEPPPASSPVRPGRIVQIALRKEEFGTLVLDVTPLEAELIVDGVAMGPGPRSIEQVAAGSHTVLGRLEGYDPMSVEVRVEPQSIARATLALTATPASAHAPKRDGGAPHVGRIALNVGVSAVGLGAGTYGLVRLLAASEAYDRYETVPSDAAAEAIYADEVVPARIQAIIGGSAAVVGIIAASGLWVTTEF